MKIDIIIVYQQRYEKGHEMDFVPPITGIHLAAITPADYEVRVIHQQVEPVNLDTDADLIALSFFSGFADEAYRLADAFRARGKVVVGGGPHVSYWPEESLLHCDAVVISEAESVWAQLLADAKNGNLRKIYQGQAQSLEGQPTPRYDLLPTRFFIPRVIQATRGCPFTCSFCTVPTLNPGFRVRPVKDVLRDVEYDNFDHWWQRKVVWFWDDNLTAKRAYIKELLRAMIPLKRWWLTQASIDIVKDPELLSLMAQSGCIGIFIGIESFGQESLRAANKRQNKVDAYRDAVATLHDYGICVMAGFIAGFDGDTPETIVDMAHQLYNVGIDVPFLSVLTPYKGTPLYDQYKREGRMLVERPWGFYNGYNVTFQPKQMSPDELLQAHRQLWNTAFSPSHVAKRIARGSRYLRTGALMMSAFMNGFYGVKQIARNEPISAKMDNLDGVRNPKDAPSKSIA
ncbi:MAG: radical SAM protein [Chloroflexota bacterium]